MLRDINRGDQHTFWPQGNNKRPEGFRRLFFSGLLYNPAGKGVQKQITLNFKITGGRRIGNGVEGGGVSLIELLSQCLLLRNV
jgi:hypothetical protein